MPSLNQKEADKAIWKKIVWPHVSDPSRIRREVKDQMEEHDRRPALMDEIERLRGFLEEKGQRVETIKTLAIEGVLKPSEARENRRATEKEIEEFQRAIAEREAEIAGYSEREAVLDDLEQEMVRFRKRLQLYERKDHTEAQPTARLRRKALIDFMGDGNIHAYPEGDHIKLVARSRLVVPHNEDKFCDASVTTGATCSACAEALLEAGASEVRVAALASPYLGLDGVPETTHSNTGPEVAGTI